MSLEDSLLAGRDAERFSLAIHEWGRQMEHARQGFVDLSRFMMGGSETGCERAERFGGGGNWRQKGQLSVKSWKSLGGEGVPAQWCYCMNWLCFILAHCCVFCHLLRRASLPSHWTPLHPSQDSELSFRLLDWHLLRLLYHKGNLFYFPVIWVPWSLHYY